MKVEKVEKDLKNIIKLCSAEAVLFSLVVDGVRANFLPLLTKSDSNSQVMDCFVKCAYTRLEECQKNIKKTANTTPTLSNLLKKNSTQEQEQELNKILLEHGVRLQKITKEINSKVKSLEQIARKAVAASGLCGLTDSETANHKKKRRGAASASASASVASTKRARRGAASVASTRRARRDGTSAGTNSASLLANNRKPKDPKIKGTIPK